MHQSYGAGRTHGTNTGDPDFHFGYLAPLRSTRYFTSVRYSSASAELIRRESFPVHLNTPRNSLTVNLSVLSLFIANIMVRQLGLLHPLRGAQRDRTFG